MACNRRQMHYRKNLAAVARTMSFGGSFSGYGGGYGGTSAASIENHNNNNNNTSERRYVLTAQPPESLKTMLTMLGADIVEADIEFKIHRSSSNNRRQHHHHHHHSSSTTVYRTSIKNERPWKLQQLQDTVNHLQQAFVRLDDTLKECPNFCSTDEVFHSMDKVLGCLLRARGSVILPKKCTAQELVKYKATKFLYPQLPDDLLLNFHLECHTLILAVHQLDAAIKPSSSSSSSRSSHHHSSSGSNNNDSSDIVYACACVVPWVNDVITMLEIALQVGQQLKDKFSVFAQYKDLIVTPKKRNTTTTAAAVDNTATTSGTSVAIPPAVGNSKTATTNDDSISTPTVTLQP